MRSTGAEVVKVAATAHQPERLRAAARRSARGAARDGRLVLIGMGDYGLATRVLAGALRIDLDLCRTRCARSAR